MKKQGADSYVCRCPFHQENTPSCVITPSKNLYHCFGCGASGSVLDWLQHTERLTYPQTLLRLRELATLQGIRDRALMELLWSTGIRRGEVAVLEVYSVDASRHIVTIVQGKGKKDRVIPVGQRALRWLAYYVQEVRPQLLVNPHCPALFVALDGVEGLTPNGITNLVSHYIRASGIAKWGSCHLFRHAMATQMLENGADLRWIQAMLGHASVESTQIYTQVSIRALQAVHASTHPAEQPDSDETGLPADLMADEEAHQDEGVDGTAKEENTNR
ncbi:tyrosine-type recombinase/integrase [Dickeya dianthicola]|nr:tyrosine-type recombinase/integrase [Dickeya dianthicola]